MTAIFGGDFKSCPPSDGLKTTVVKMKERMIL
jgi:hypothetical protein